MLLSELKVILLAVHLESWCSYDVLMNYNSNAMATAVTGRHITFEIVTFVRSHYSVLVLFSSYYVDIKHEKISRGKYVTVIKVF